jgi:hypothetical protein
MHWMRVLFAMLVAAFLAFAGTHRAHAAPACDCGASCPMHAQGSASCCGGTDSAPVAPAAPAPTFETAVIVPVRATSPLPVAAPCAPVMAKRAAPRAPPVPLYARDCSLLC